MPTPPHMEGRWEDRPSSPTRAESLEVSSLKLPTMVVPNARLQSRVNRNQKSPRSLAPSRTSTTRKGTLTQPLLPTTVSCLQSQDLNRELGKVKWWQMQGCLCSGITRRTVVHNKHWRGHPLLIDNRTKQFKLSTRNTRRKTTWLPKVTRSQFLRPTRVP